MKHERAPEGALGRGTLIDTFILPLGLLPLGVCL